MTAQRHIQKKTNTWKNNQQEPPKKKMTFTAPTHGEERVLKRDPEGTSIESPHRKTMENANRRQRKVKTKFSVTQLRETI